MPESISIRERICRQVRTNVAAISGIGDVVRWDARGKYRAGSTWVETLDHLDAMVFASDDEGIAEGSEGSIGTVIKTLPVFVFVVIRQDEDDTTSTDALVNKWLAALEYKLTADPFVIETATSVRLASDSEVTRLYSAPREEGEREAIAGVMFEVEYTHDRNSPYQYGTAIPVLTE